MAHGNPVRCGLCLRLGPGRSPGNTEREIRMSTITETSTDTLTVSAESVRELLAGAATQAHAKEDLPALNAVKIYTEGGRLYAVATDRYRLIEGSVEIEGSLAVTVLRLADIKRILDLLKAKSLDRMPVTINRVGDLVSVAVAGDSLTARTWDCNYPPHAHLFEAGDPVAVDSITFNPAIFADYAKIEKLAGAKRSAGVTVSFYGDRKPIGIQLHGEKVAWRALLMPMKKQA